MSSTSTPDRDQWRQIPDRTLMPFLRGWPRVGVRCSQVVYHSRESWYQTIPECRLLAVCVFFDAVCRPKIPQMPAEQFGERLRREREKAAMSLAQLADASGISKPYLVRLENEPSNPSLELLGRLAEALDVTVADLLGGPRYRVDQGELHVAPLLRAFADEQALSSAEVRTLASIKFRKGDEPRSTERWAYIYNSLRLSRGLDPDAETDEK
ncbi:MAG: helix-turn-helix domain-containing protein [Actinobacteria bacterium]|nr:MAG: helix-turn-helix domain-containing protein [Actinomycetota bacterium]